jgi:hypothetical protein
VRKITALDRILLLGTCLLAAYQISIGLDDINIPATWGFTVGFGTLLVAGLLLIILGFEGLERQPLVIVSTLIPLSISYGLISLYFPKYSFPYLVFSVVGFVIIAITRFTAPGKAAAIILALVHGIAGVTITFLPVALSMLGRVRPGYMLVGLGGGLIGLGGLSLTFLRAGKPLLSRENILSVLPALLFLMTAAFIGGFSFQ